MIEAAEPTIGGSAMPTWLIVLSFILLFLALVTFDINSGWFRTEIYAPFHSPEEVAQSQPLSDEFPWELAGTLYRAHCGICHREDGSGKPNEVPPLAGSEWANGSATRMIRIPLVGLAGQIKVNGRIYNNSMPAMGAGMSDRELALVLNYVRMSWRNKAGEVSAAQVKTTRDALAGRTEPLTEMELLRLPEK